MAYLYFLLGDIPVTLTRNGFQQIIEALAALTVTVFQFPLIDSILTPLDRALDTDMFGVLTCWEPT